MYLIILIVCIVIILVISYYNKSSTNRPQNRTIRSTQNPKYPSLESRERDNNVFRPSGTKNIPRKKRIKFNEKSENDKPPSELDIKDLVDALTGAPLQLASGLFQCRRCKVFYQAYSFEVIQNENGGRCVSCLQPEISSVTGRQEKRGRNADVSIITLEDYRQYVGHVVTFEGQVRTVLTSRRGKDYAAMFEDKTWTRGFKMIVFRGDIGSIGGSQLLFSLVGHIVRVRGLLIKHERFGYEIIVSDRAMISRIQ